MKKFYLLFALLLFANLSFSQTKKLKEQLKSIEDQWSVDEYDNVTYSETISIKNKDKETLYKNVQGFLAFNFVPDFDNSEILNFDKSFIISAKGNIFFLEDIYIKFPRKERYISAIFNFECKDNVVNITVFFKEYITDYEFYGETNSIKKYKLTSVYPFNQTAVNKNTTGKDFYDAFMFTIEKINELKIYLTGS